jgi:leucyl-tRNA synthetase
MSEFVSKEEPIEITSALHKAIKKVGEDIESFSFNTAISAMMIFVNAVYDAKKISKKSFDKFLTILSPFAPHITEEIWQTLGNKKSIYLSKWPEYDPKLLVTEKVNMVVQINGKVRATIAVSVDATESDTKELALAEPKISALIANQEIKKTIVIKGRVVNFVI